MSVGHAFSCLSFPWNPVCSYQHVPTSSQITYLHAMSVAVVGWLLLFSHSHGNLYVTLTGTCVSPSPEETWSSPWCYHSVRPTESQGILMCGPWREFRGSMKALKSWEKFVHMSGRQCCGLPTGVTHFFCPRRPPGVCANPGVLLPLSGN